MPYDDDLIIIMIWWGWWWSQGGHNNGDGGGGGGGHNNSEQQFQFLSVSNRSLCLEWLPWKFHDKINVWKWWWGDHDDDLDEDDDDDDDNMGWEFPCLFTQPLQTDCWKESFAEKAVNVQIGDLDDHVLSGDGDVYTTFALKLLRGGFC